MWCIPHWKHGCCQWPEKGMPGDRWGDHVVAQAAAQFELWTGISPDMVKCGMPFSPIRIFNPFKTKTGPTMKQLTPKPVSSPRIVTVPGSKSISHRMLICAALCSGTSRIRNLLDSQDLGLTRDALSCLGQNRPHRWRLGPGDRICRASSTLGRSHIPGQLRHFHAASGRYHRTRHHSVYPDR